jgi:hypothetical protein
MPIKTSKGEPIRFTCLFYRNPRHYVKRSERHADKADKLHAEKNVSGFEAGFQGN